MLAEGDTRYMAEVRIDAYRYRIISDSNSFQIHGSSVRLIYSVAVTGVRA